MAKPKKDPEKQLPDGLRPEDVFKSPIEPENEQSGEPQPMKSEDFEADGPLPEGFDIANLPKGEAAPIEDVEFEGKTLSGDVRDILLGHIRSMSKPWAMMSEQEQTDKIHAITETGKHVVRGVVSVVSRNKFPAVSVIVGAWKVDKALEIKVGAAPSVGNVTLLAEHKGEAGLLILAEASDYFGERAPAKPSKDQPSLQLDDEDDD